MGKTATTYLGFREVMWHPSEFFPAMVTSESSMLNLNRLVTPHQFCGLYTLWLFNIAMENGLFIDGLPIINGGSFHGYVSHNQMVYNDHNVLSG